MISAKVWGGLFYRFIQLISGGVEGVGTELGNPLDNRT